MTTGQMMEPRLRHEFGDEWRFVCVDLDQAVYEFGTWIESTRDKAVRAYQEQIGRINARLRKSNANAATVKPDPRRYEHIHMETVAKLVDRKMIRVSMGAEVGPGGMAQQGGLVVETKPMTGDPLVDNNWNTPDVEIQSLE